MEFYHLRSFVVVAKTGNLTLAAKQLHTTPPAISSHIKVLEEELQTPLFIRSSKGMKLTKKGDILLEKAQHTLDSAFDLINAAASNQNEIIGTFRLSINQKPAQLKISRLVENMLKNTPGITLQIHPMSTGKTVEAIRTEELDGGFIYGDIPSDLTALKIKLQKITTITPYNCTLIQQSPYQKPWITMGYYCPFDDFLKSKLGTDIHSVVSSNDEETRLELVKSGVGMSFYEFEEAQIYEQRNEISIFPELDFETPLYFVVAKNKINSPVVQAVLHDVRAIWEII